MAMDEGGRGSGQIDLARLDDAFYQNPYPQYADWQSRGPVLPLADGGWLLTRHADLSAVYRNRTAFSADKKAAFGPKFGIGTPLYAHHTTSLVFSDPPYHTRVRRQIVGALSPGAIRSLVPGLIALVDGLCERIGRDGRCEQIPGFERQNRRTVTLARPAGNSWGKGRLQPVEHVHRVLHTRR